MHSREFEEKDLLLRVYIGANDHHQGRTLYEVIVQKALEEVVTEALITMETI